MTIRRDVFKAIADPTRREIIGLTARQPLNINAVSESFDMSRQAVALHLKILAECGLIVIRQEGREKYCEAKLDSLSEVSDWIEGYRQHWDRKLDALENALSNFQKKKKHGRRKKR